VTHEARDPRLTRAEVFEYLKVVNSAAQISTGLTKRIDRSGLEAAKNDIIRFVGVAVNRILAVRQAVEERESDPLEDAWDIEDDE
jgi:hypothetical protein